MKIIEGEDLVLKVYHENFEEENICLHFEDKVYYLTPLEANVLSDLLKKNCNETEYFQGLKRNE